MRDWMSRGRDSTRHAFEPEPLDLPLRMVWETKVSGAILAPAVGMGNAVFICSLGALNKIDAETGTITWEYPYRELPKPQLNSYKSSPTIVGDRVIFTDMAGTVYCVDAHTSELLWVVEDLYSRSESVAFYEGKIYLRAVQDAAHGEEHGYACLDLEASKIWFRALAGPVRTVSPAVGGGKLICGDATGFVYCLNAETGDMEWKTDIRSMVDDPERFDRISVRGIPMIVEDLVVVRIGDYRNVCALRLESGAAAWVHVSDKNLGHVGFANCLAADDRRMYYTMRNLFRSIDLESGEILLTTDNGYHEFGGSSALAGIVVGRHYIAGFNMSQKLAAFNVDTGEVEWEFTGDGGFTDEATYFDGGIVIGDDLGYVRRFAPGS